MRIHETDRAHASPLGRYRFSIPYLPCFFKRCAGFRGRIYKEKQPTALQTQSRGLRNGKIILFWKSELVPHFEVFAGVAFKASLLERDFDARCAEGDASVLIIIAPMHGVLDDAADVRIVEGTVRLVARLEIEDLAVAAGEGAAAAEDFADVAFA